MELAVVAGGRGVGAVGALLLSERAMARLVLFAGEPLGLVLVRALRARQVAAVDVRAG